VKQTADATSVAVDFTEAAGTSLSGQDPADLSLAVEVKDPTGEVEMAQVTPAQLDTMMADPVPASVEPVAAIAEPAVAEMGMDIVEPMGLPDMSALDLSAEEAFGFRRRRLAAVNIKKADVYYAAIVKSSKGA